MNVNVVLATLFWKDVKRAENQLRIAKECLQNSINKLSEEELNEYSRWVEETEKVYQQHKDDRSRVDLE